MVFLKKKNNNNNNDNNNNKENELVEREYMELLNYENQMIEETIDSYQNEFLCPVCESGNLFENYQCGIIKCSNCSLQISNKVI